MHCEFHESLQPASTLVVVLHGAGGSPQRMGSIVSVIRQSLPDADLLLPRLPYEGWLGLASFAKAEDIARDVVLEMDRLYQLRQYRSIRIVGYSYGAVLARKIVILAHGQKPDAPFEPSLANMAAGTAWAQRISRVVLLAGMSRGWSPATARNWFLSAQWEAMSLIGELLRVLIRRSPTIFAIRQGAPFIVQTRLQWLALMKHLASAETAAANAEFATVQALGTIDDFVSPADVVDHAVDAGGSHAGKFYFIEMPGTGHLNAIDMAVGGADSMQLFPPAADKIAEAVGAVMAATHPTTRSYELIRGAILALALSGATTELAKLAVPLAHLGCKAQPDPQVKHLVFVIHGIRDRGFWTQKIGRAILQEWQRRHAHAGSAHECTVLAPSYGYFAMAPFLLPWVRRQKAEWFMDQYTEARALYPNAAISFVGHSNGTYIAARALQDYPALRFKRVVFAGSVVRKRYDWTRVLNTHPPRVESVLNYVATKDWVVAIFPNGLQPFSFFFDLGSAGHTGFIHNHEASATVLQQVKFVIGEHSAGIKETQWDDIARFVVAGVPPKSEQAKRSPAAVLAGWLSPVFVAMLAAGIFGIGAWMVKEALAAGAAGAMWAGFFAVYTVACYLILSRV